MKRVLFMSVLLFCLCASPQTIPVVLQIRRCVALWFIAAFWASLQAMPAKCMKKQVKGNNTMCNPQLGALNIHSKPGSPLSYLVVTEQVCCFLRGNTNGKWVKKTESCSGVSTFVLRNYCGSMKELEKKNMSVNTWSAAPQEQSLQWKNRLAGTWSNTVSTGA